MIVTPSHIQAPDISPDSSTHYDLHGDALNAALCDASAFPKHGGQRIAWLHVPKCGTNFMATVVHYACPRLPEYLSIAELIHEEAQSERERESARVAGTATPPSPAQHGTAAGAGGAILQTNVWSLLHARYNVTANCFAPGGFLVDHGRAVYGLPGGGKGGGGSGGGGSGGGGSSGAIVGWRPHVPLRDWPTEEGHLVALFRPPAQRLLSAYYQESGPHGVPRFDRSKLATPATYARYCAGDGGGGGSHGGSSSASGGASGGGRAGTPPAEMRCMANKMCSYVVGRTCRSWADAREAVQRLRKGFAFVGLTDLWTPSVCLFHRMLGGAPRAGEFESSRVNRGVNGTGSEKRSGRYDEAQLEGYRDEYDEALYAAARARFVHELQLATGWRCAIDAGGELMCSTAASSVR